MDSIGIDDGQPYWFGGGVDGNDAAAPWGGPGTYDVREGAEPEKPRWAGREAARAATRFPDRVIAAFRAPDNLNYLRVLFAEKVPHGPLRTHILETLHDAVLNFSDGEGRAYDVIGADLVGWRGAAGRSTSLWGEVRRLNRVFFEDRLGYLREHAAVIDPRAPRDGIADDNEQFADRMFIADSLRPPGLEHLNTPGPLYALREDQSTYVPLTRRPPPGAPAPGPGVNVNARTRMPRDAPGDPYPGCGAAKGKGRREGFMSANGHSTARGGRAAQAIRGAAGKAPLENSKAGFAGHRPDTDVYLYGEDDAPWSMGDPNRTPEEAVAEYWGDGWSSSETMIGGPETGGRTYGEMYGWGTSWKENGGSEAFRWRSIPFWQKGGREGYDYDIEETLGTAGREMDGQVRAWSQAMERLREPRGQEYRRYGPRSGPVVGSS